MFVSINNTKIINVSILPATVAQANRDQHYAECAERERIRMEKQTEAIPTILAAISADIDRLSKAGYRVAGGDWLDSYKHGTTTRYGMTARDVRELRPMLEEILHEAGYRTYYHEYSDSWRAKSGKQFEWKIRW